MTMKVLVVGSGAIGLRTALELLRKQCTVVLQSARHPLEESTCSQGAGGLWMPYKCEDKRVERWSLETLDELLAITAAEDGGSGSGALGSGKGRACVVGRRTSSLVEVMPALYLKRENDTMETPSWTMADPRLNFQTITPEILAFQNRMHQLRIPPPPELTSAGYHHGWLFQTPIVDVGRMLKSMLAEILRHPCSRNADLGKEFKSVQDMVDTAVRLGCDAVVNCTGLSSRELCQDNSMLGGRGVLLYYGRGCKRRKEFLQGDDGTASHDVALLVDEPPWGTALNSCYLIPRGDMLVVGGSFLEGDDEVTVRANERAMLEHNAFLLGIDTEHARPMKEWAGFRPCRPTVRLEVDRSIDTSVGVKFVHNYGHGGSGWTVFAGVAKDVAQLLGV